MDCIHREELIGKVNNSGVYVCGKLNTLCGDTISGDCRVERILPVIGSAEERVDSCQTCQFFLSKKDFQKSILLRRSGW